MLVLLAEEGEKILAKKYIIKYLKPFLGKSRPQASGKIQALVLGCTHYSFYKNEIRKILKSKIKVISQDEVIPRKLRNYFAQHSEISKKLSKNKRIKILVTKKTHNITKLSQKWFGKNIKPKLIKL